MQPVKDWRVAFFLLAGLFWLLFHFDSFSYYWWGDDFHLIRSYSPAELQSTFFGTWDPNHIETPGYRPLAALWNHLRYTLFGESLFLHRVFQFLLAFGFLFIADCILRRLGFSPPVLYLGITFFISTKAFTTALIWLTDGMLLLNWTWMALSVLSLLWFYDAATATQQIRYLILMEFFYLLAIFSKEDSLILMFFLPAVYIVVHSQAGWFGKYSGQRWIVTAKAFLLESRSFLFLLFFILLFPAVVLIIMRSLWVERSLSDMVSKAGWNGFLSMLQWTLCPIGYGIRDLKIEWGSQRGYSLSTVLPYCWYFGLGMLIALRLTVKKDKVSHLSGILLSCIGVTALPGFFAFRTNLVFLPVFFFCLLLAYWLIDLHYYYRQEPNIRIFIKIFIVFLLFFSLQRAVLLRQSMHPCSLNQVISWYGWIYGDFSEGRPSIPDIRRQETMKRLQKMGLHAGMSDAEYERVIIHLAQEADRNNRYSPQDGLCFIPRVTQFSP